MLEAINLVGVRGERRLFNRLSFQVRAGECLLVRGENGSGKTTLLRMLAGLTASAEGAIRWKGRLLDEQLGEYRRDMLYCGHGLGLKEDLNAMENLLIIAALAGISTTPALVSDALKEVGLAGRESLPVRGLSQGQKRRAGLARLLLQQSSLWILDEPLTALDTAGSQWLADVIDQHLLDGGMLVLTSHQHLSLAGTSHSIRMGA